jgi:hypothetical protein
MYEIEVIVTTLSHGIEIDSQLAAFLAASARLCWRFCASSCQAKPCHASRSLLSDLSFPPTQVFGRICNSETAL